MNKFAKAIIGLGIIGCAIVCIVVLDAAGAKAKAQPSLQSSITGKDMSGTGEKGTKGGCWVFGCD